MLDQCTIEMIWPFVPPALFLLLCASVYLWVRSQLIRIDQNFKELDLWALEVTNRLNKIRWLSHSDLPPTPNMKQFSGLAKQFEDQVRAEQDDSTAEIPK